MWLISTGPTVRVLTAGLEVLCFSLRSGWRKSRGRRTCLSQLRVCRSTWQLVSVTGVPFDLTEPGTSVPSVKFDDCPRKGRGAGKMIYRFREYREVIGNHGEKEIPCKRSSPAICRSRTDISAEPTSTSRHVSSWCRWDIWCLSELELQVGNSFTKRKRCKWCDSQTRLSSQINIRLAVPI